MSPEQQVALQHVCYIAHETSRPRFAHMVRGGSLVLSVNSGYE